MEESVEFQYFKDIFQLEHKDANSYSPLALAYIGDSVFDVMVRTMIVSRVNKQVNKYHREASRLVCASAQAQMIKAIYDNLTLEEQEIYKRGRNANSYTKAKNATRGEYRTATGFEAVLGYLYLKEDFKRLTDVVKLALQSVEMEGEKE